MIPITGETWLNPGAGNCVPPSPFAEQGERTNGPPTAAISALEPGRSAEHCSALGRSSAPAEQCSALRFMGRAGVRSWLRRHKWPLPSSGLRPPSPLAPRREKEQPSHRCQFHQSSHGVGMRTRPCRWKHRIHEGRNNSEGLVHKISLPSMFPPLPILS